MQLAEVVAFIYFQRRLFPLSPSHCNLHTLPFNQLHPKLGVNWSNLTYPIKAKDCIIWRWPEPKSVEVYKSFWGLQRSDCPHWQYVYGKPGSVSALVIVALVLLPCAGSCLCTCFSLFFPARPEGGGRWWTPLVLAIGPARSYFVWAAVEQRSSLKINK